MAKKQPSDYQAQIVLGKRIERLRLRCGLSRMQLGRAINQKEQQIGKYEAGAFVPLPMLEKIAEVLGDPIQKRLIRKISFFRKLEQETKTEQSELLELYQEILCGPEED